MTTFFAGQPLLAQELEDLRTFAIPSVVAKTADESVSSNIVPQDDNELFLSVSANASYRINMHLVVTSASNVGDIYISFNAPAGSRMTASAAGVEQAATGVIGQMNAGAFFDVTTFPSTPYYAYGVTASPTGIILVGTLIVGATAGTFQLRWSQATSSATATIVKSGSALELSRYA